MSRNLSSDPEGTIEEDPCPTCGWQITVPRRQHDVLVLTATGSDARTTAQRLGCGAGTVERDLVRLRALTGARTNGQLVVIAARAGLLPPQVPRRHPGPLTDPQRQLFAVLAEGQTLHEAADAVGMDRTDVVRVQHAVHRRLGVKRLPAALAMLCALGELAHRHPCTRPECELARLDRQQHADVRQDAEEAARQWADALAQAAAQRAEFQGARAELQRLTAELALTRAQLDAVRHEMDRALESCRTAAKQARSVSDLADGAAEGAGAVRVEVNELRAQVRAAGREAQWARSIAHDLRQDSAVVREGIAEVDKGRAQLAAGWLDLAAARENAAKAPDATRPPPVPRTPIPLQHRPWHRSGPVTPERDESRS
ncbi:hypothetical protein ABTY61_32300 [Kitasatospora sp. NPDC096128]|uniref:hypothetical protein n=1 Tax=Kitasatospora sp. NPDC096128 TaxID=3155547 RepID=UPI003318199F